MEKDFEKIQKIINFKDKSKLIILTGEILSGKTKMMIKLLKEALQKNEFVVFYCFEMNKTNVIQTLDCNISNVIINDKASRRKFFVEDILKDCEKINKYQKIDWIMIDGVFELQTKENYVLGQGDINSIILKKLKKTAQNLNIPIIVTAISGKKSKEEFYDNSKIILKDFCKKEMAEEFVDEIIRV